MENRKQNLGTMNRLGTLEYINYSHNSTIWLSTPAGEDNLTDMMIFGTKDDCCLTHEKSLVQRQKFPLDKIIMKIFRKAVAYASKLEEKKINQWADVLLRKLPGKYG